MPVWFARLVRLRFPCALAAFPWRFHPVRARGRARLLLGSLKQLALRQLNLLSQRCIGGFRMVTVRSLCSLKFLSALGDHTGVHHRLCLMGRCTSNPKMKGLEIQSQSRFTPQSGGVSKIERKLKSPTGHWSVPDFNFFTFLRLARKWFPKWFRKKFST